MIFRKTPLSALWAAQSEFSSARHIFRAHLYQNAAPSPFLRAAPRCRGKRQKRGFACARIIFIISAILHSTFYIYHLRRRADVNSVTLSGAASGNREPRSRTGLLRSLLCHFDLVVTRLCCQHFAVWQNARLARRLLLFPKISLRCDFREPCYNNPPSGEILRGAYQKTHAFPIMPSPFLRGKVARAACCA